MPKAALAPLAISILALLVWSSRGGSRGAPSASTVRQETRASADVVRPGREATRASANAGVVVQDGRRVFEPFERKRRGGRTSAEDGENGGIGAEETRVERVRQIIDDSHLPSLPPLPPDAPLSPPEEQGRAEAFGAGGETGRDETETETAAGAASKRVAGGEFVWSLPTRASRRVSLTNVVETRALNRSDESIPNNV